MPGQAQSLWVLTIGVVMFVFVFGLFFTFSSQIYGAQAEYGAFISSNRGGGTTYANSVNFTLEWDIGIPSLLGSHAHSEVLSNLTITFDVAQFNAPDTEGWLRVMHAEPQWVFSSIYYIKDDLVMDDGNYAINKYILSSYDPVSDSASFRMSCPHVEVFIVVYSNSSTVRLQDALWNRQPIHLTVSSNPRYDSATGDILGFMYKTLTFQIFKVGDYYVDLFLNLITCAPIYLAAFYIVYRLVTGALPTLSGGGGQ